MRTTKRTAVRFLTFLLALTSYSASAESWLTMPAYSWHFSGREDGKGSYETMNTGLGLEHVVTPSFRVAAGIYRNSVRRDSGYFGVGYLPLQLGPVRIGASAGVVSGYTSNLLPVLVPTLTIEGKQFGVNLLVVPPAEGSPSVIGVVLKFKLP